MHYGNFIDSKKEIIDDLTSCMFEYIRKNPELEEGNLNATYTDRFKNTIANVSIFNKRPEHSAPPIEHKQHRISRRSRTFCSTNGRNWWKTQKIIEAKNK